MLAGLAGGIALLYDLSHFDLSYFSVRNNAFFRFYVHTLFFLHASWMMMSRLYLKERRVAGRDWTIALIMGLLLLLYYTDPANRYPYLWQLSDVTLFTTALLLFIFSFSQSLSQLETFRLNTGLLFTGSFAFVILAGTLLLLSPNASYKGVSFVDALFTSTSAVCVTGLTVLDTAKDYTRFGQSVILLLIQIGGLGIMTFTGLLGYVLTGYTTLQNQLILKDVMNARNTAEVFGFIKKIIAGTLLIEALGTVFIFFQITDNEVPGGLGERLFFSLFHAVSGFCNAGFSTFSNNLYDPALRFNYPFLLIIILLIILGGLGFPIMVNVYQYLKVQFISRYQQIVYGKPYKYLPRLIHIQTYIVIGTTLLLLLAGTVGFLLTEYHHSLREHPGWTGKIILSFLGSVSPRTAGFNAVNMAELQIGTILITMLLMWIGASPASTGGGIKTTTFTIATLHYFNAIRGKFKLEFMNREISRETVNKALAIVSLSIATIGLSTFLISLFEGSKENFLYIFFEVISAFSTVGLSLNFTPGLSDPSKIVLVFTMLVGRVGLLTVLSGFIRPYRSRAYQFPKEDIVL